MPTRAAPSPDPRSSSARAAIGSSENSPQARTLARPARAATVVSSMSTQTIAASPDAATTAIAWRQRISGCEGTTKPAA